MPGFSGGLVVTTLVCFVLFSHARLRVHRAPGIPRALCSEGGNKWIPRAKKYAARMRSHVRLSSPAQAGDPVFQRRQRWNREAAAYWVARSSRAMTHVD